jgi:hypothetical protein
MIAGVKNAVKENLFIHTFKIGVPSLKSLSISLFSYYTWLLHQKNLKMARISIKQNYIQGAAAKSVESLGRCCEPGNENIVGSSSLTCSPGGKNHISVSQRPPLAKMWWQEQFR